MFFSWERGHELSTCGAGGWIGGAGGGGGWGGGGGGGGGHAKSTSLLLNIDAW